MWHFLNQCSKVLHKHAAVKDKCVNHALVYLFPVQWALPFVGLFVWFSTVMPTSIPFSVYLFITRYPITVFKFPFKKNTKFMCMKFVHGSKQSCSTICSRFKAEIEASSQGHLLKKYSILYYSRTNVLLFPWMNCDNHLYLWPSMFRALANLRQ